MRRLTYHFSVAVMTFVVGVGSHLLVLRLAEALLADPISSNFESYGESEVQIFSDRQLVVISLTDHRDLYLGKDFVGGPDETRELEMRIAKARVNCEQQFMETEQNRLGRIVCLEGCDKIVYIKAATTSSYGDVAKIVDAAQRAGARRIGLIADRRKQDYQIPHSSSCFVFR